MKRDWRVKKTMRVLALCFILLCQLSGPAVSAPRSDIELSRSARGPFDRYGRIFWQDEKARLDNFAILLSQDPSYLGYLYVFDGPNGCRREAEARALRARRYVIEYRGVPWNRVIWRAGGYRDDLTTVLWVLTSDQASSPPAFHFEPPQKETHVTKNCKALIAQIKRSKW